MRLCQLAVVIVAALAAGAVHAVNMNVMKDAPITRLSSDEVKTFRAFIIKTLDEASDGATMEWAASKTKFNSKVTPQTTFSDGKLKCRQVRIESDAADRHERGEYVLCKVATGDWRFKTAGDKSKSGVK
jgi:surface antigen